MTLDTNKARFTVRGTHNGSPFEVTTTTQDEAERLASDFRGQGAADVVVANTV